MPGVAHDAHPACLAGERVTQHDAQFGPVVVGQHDVGGAVKVPVGAADHGDARSACRPGALRVGLDQHRPEAGVLPVAQQVPGYRGGEHRDEGAPSLGRRRVAVRDLVGGRCGSVRDITVLGITGPGITGRIVDRVGHTAELATTRPARPRLGLITKGTLKVTTGYRYAQRWRRRPADMRRPSSIAGRLRTGFALFVILLAGAGAIIYAGFAHQGGASRQLNDQIYVLRHYVAQLDNDFADGQVAVANYQLTFEHRFLSEYDGDGADFASDLVFVRRYAQPGQRGLIDTQARAGTEWFTLANKIVDDPAYTAGDTARTDQAWATSERFKAANAAMEADVNGTVNCLIRQSRSEESRVGKKWR